MSKDQNFNEDFIDREWNMLETASQSIKKYIKGNKMTSVTDVDNKLTFEKSDLKFIAQYKDPYLDKSIGFEEILKTSDNVNESSYEEYDDNNYVETNKEQTLEEEKVPAFYRNTMKKVS